MGNLKIALGFSGGGFRASAFNLGVLSYLARLHVGDKSLLEHVVALSTVSGGTVTGARYAIGIKQGESFDEIYAALYSFMKDMDLVSLGIDRLTTEQGWEEGRIRSLINAFADIYDKHLFKGAKFGVLLTDNNPIHLKHISFNATEFSNGLQFRFQWSDKIINPVAGEFPRGIIGNTNYRVTELAAKELRMGDILAASSCFPGGFEPINFPSDFIYEGADELKSLIKEDGYPVGLMDGGIVDNQGIEPILLAEKRMKRNESGSTGNVIDLVVVSDVASPFMEGYNESKQAPDKGLRSLTPALLLTINSILLLVSLVAIVFAYRNGYLPLLIGSTVLATTSLIFYMIGGFIKNLPLKLQVPKSFMVPLGKLLRLKFRVYENLIMNRANSVLKLTNDVFLKHVRRLNYNKLYQDEKWLNRRMMNAIYELKPGSPGAVFKIEKLKLPPKLIPSIEMEKIAQMASSMGTTLWFTKDEIRCGMLDSLIACGQFTFCWNLLEYINNLKKDNTNTNASHQDLIALEANITADWKAFLNDPLFLVRHSHNDILKKDILQQTTV